MTEVIIAAAVPSVLSLIATIIVAVVNGKLSQLTKHDKEQYLSILRLTVMSEEMPISERLIAGKKYIDNGGNGDVKHYYETLLTNHIK